MNFEGFRYLLREDLKRNCNNSKGKFIVFMYRFSAYMYSVSKRKRYLAIFCAPIIAFYKIVSDYIMGIYIPVETNIGKGLCVYHGVGIVIHPASVIGDYCTLRQGVTIGSRDGTDATVPIIGSGVSVGALAVIIGRITIGDAAIVGAGAVVARDVPAGCTAIGNPATIKSAACL